MILAKDGCPADEAEEWMVDLFLWADLFIEEFAIDDDYIDDDVANLWVDLFNLSLLLYNFCYWFDYLLLLFFLDDE